MCKTELNWLCGHFNWAIFKNSTRNSRNSRKFQDIWNFPILDVKSDSVPQIKQIWPLKCFDWVIFKNSTGNSRNSRKFQDIWNFPNLNENSCSAAQIELETYPTCSKQSKLKKFQRNSSGIPGIPENSRKSQICGKSF